MYAAHKIGIRPFDTANNVSVHFPPSADLIHDIQAVQVGSSFREASAPPQVSFPVAKRSTTLWEDVESRCLSQTRTEYPASI